MLIVNDTHCGLAGVASLEERCGYCAKPLAAYPLVMSDDTSQTVYHVTCVLELATDLMADIFTFFSPPTPYPPLFVLTTSDAASARVTCGERAQTEGVTHAINEYAPNEGSHSRSGVHRQRTGVVSNRRCGRRQKEERAALGIGARVGPLVSR